MTHQRATQKRYQAEGRCITCGKPAGPAKRKEGKSLYCVEHREAMNARARRRYDSGRVRKPAVRTVDAKLTMRVLNSHSKNCKPARAGWRWKVDGDRAHELIPFFRRSFFGDMRGDGWRFILLVCNSTIGCPASALVRLEDIELAAEGVLD